MRTHCLSKDDGALEGGTYLLWSNASLYNGDDVATSKLPEPNLDNAAVVGSVL
jgi:hypothetical protein